jgi:hypothetical protein
MRRPVRLRSSRAALAAVYDALLFLMVAILISAGMFLYSATAVSEGGDFAESMHQRRCDNQLTTVENLAVNQTDPLNSTRPESWSVPTPHVRWTNGTNISDIPLTEEMVSTPVESVRWLLESYCTLTWRNEQGEAYDDGTYDASAVLGAVDGLFEDSQLNGTEHAWQFLFEGEERLFGSSSIDRVEDLPADRWASSRDYSVNTTAMKYSAELRYYMWFP